MKKYAIIGFGGLGKVHFLNLLEIEKARGDIELKAICNSSLEGITKSMELNITSVSMDNIDFSKYNLYTDYKEMLEKEELDFVFIALPSHLHAEVSVYCLKKGLDVFSEKPMAIVPKDCRMMADCAKECRKKLMIGQALRFSDEYIFLKDAIDNGTYGKPVKAEFSRKSPLPLWSSENWLLKDDKSGGCIIDMHVHDVDIMVWLFGKPLDVHTVSSHKMAEFESVYAIYSYPDISVSINTDWGIHSSYKFKATYGVTFEDAYVECIGNEITVYKNDGTEKFSVSKDNPMYKREIEEFVDCVVCDKPFQTTSLESVCDTMDTVFTEKYGKEKI
ncbi:MAG: Gfo/Idh/MocA family oxidoreductase [Ruminococcaceae bacterium]|nr:Gfo/Idh/MocA family oxidoreductase [Oscillospiraceae bacterium]